MPHSDLSRIGAEYAALTAPRRLARALRDPVLGKVALVSSFGADSVVLLHMAAQADRNVPVIFLDTQMLFAETLDYQHQVARHLGLRDLRVIRPNAGDLVLDDPAGDLHRRAPDACCDLRKTRPLEQALDGFDTWVTGRKRFQSGGRQALPVIEAEPASGRLKLNPLADWSARDLARYMDDHDLPRHPLVARGFRSIGCAPCTSPTKEGEDPRAGRWRGQDKEECGIHFENGRIVRRKQQEEAA